MKHKTHTIIFCIALFTGTMAFAQNDSTLNKQVEVIKAYQPDINDAYKLGRTPIISDTNTYVPTFDYRIHSSSIPVNKNINHLPVVQLGSPPLAGSNTGYAKAGIGNALTSYGELLLNTSPAPNTDFGMHLYHFSSRPQIKLIGDEKVKAPYSNSLAKIFIKNYFRKSILQWDLAYQRDRINFYGIAPGDTLSQLFHENHTPGYNDQHAANRASALVNLKNSYNRAALDYQLIFDYDYLWNTSQQQAHKTGYQGIFSNDQRDYQLKLDTRFDFFQQSNIQHYFIDSLTTRHFFLAGLTPQFEIKRNNIELKAGFNLDALINPDSAMLWNISPKVYFAYHPIKGMLTIFAGSDGGIAPNNYYQAREQNPFLDPFADVQPTQELVNLFGGFKGKISRKVSYLFDLAYSMKLNTPLYFFSEIQGSDTTYFNRFTPVYDDINTLRFGAKLRYSSSGLNIELKGNYYVYEANKLDVLPHMPAYDASLTSALKLNNKIRASLIATLIGPRDGGYQINSFTSMGDPIQRFSTLLLDPIIDVKLEVTYQYSEALSFFINASNLLNQKRAFYTGYPQQGLMIMLGAAYTF